MPDSFDLDRGLLLAVQAIQVRSKRLGNFFFVLCFEDYNSIGHSYLCV